MSILSALSKAIARDNFERAAAATHSAPRAAPAPAPQAAPAPIRATIAPGWFVQKRYNQSVLYDLTLLARWRGYITSDHAFVAAIFIAHLNETDRAGAMMAWLREAGVSPADVMSHLDNRVIDLVFESKTPWRISKEKMREKLSLTDDEIAQLRTLQSDDEKIELEKERARSEHYRRAAGAISRKDYISKADARRAQVLLLRAENLTYAQIAFALETTENNVAVMLHRANEKEKARIAAARAARIVALHSAGRAQEEIAEICKISLKAVAAALKAEENGGKQKKKKRKRAAR